MSKYAYNMQYITKKGWKRYVTGSVEADSRGDAKADVIEQYNPATILHILVFKVDDDVKK